mgnify:CR=1 FL=1
MKDEKAEVLTDEKLEEMRKETDDVVRQGNKTRGR